MAAFLTGLLTLLCLGIYLIIIAVDAWHDSPHFWPVIALSCLAILFVWIAQQMKD